MYRFGSGMFLVNPFIFAQSLTGYIVDDYSPVVAYSLRKLSSSATVAVRVRRSSDNAEQDIGFSGDDLDTTSLSSFVGSGTGFIAKWYNQGTGGATYDSSQSTAGFQPRSVFGGSVLTKNGKTAVFFDGSLNNRLTTTALTDLQSYPFTIVAVASNETSNVNAPVVSQRLQAGDNSGYTMFVDRSAGNVCGAVDSGATSNAFNYPSQINNNNQRLQFFKINSSGDGESFLNGTSQEAINSISSYASTPTDLLQLGRQLVGPSQLNGYIQEVIIFGTDESANRTAIESNINSYYAIY